MSALNRFVFKCCCLLLPVALLFVGLYFWLDPFKVLYTYEDYYDRGRCVVALDRDFVSTEVYTRKRAEWHYNSFIMGNSRSLSFLTAVWDSCLNHPSGNSYYHFDASSESLYALAKKLEYIDRQGDSIKNLLLIVDPDLLSRTDYVRNHLYLPSPRLLGNSLVDRVHFQYVHFKDFCSPKFVLALLDYRLNQRFRPYMHGLLENYSVLGYCETTNEQIYRTFDDEIARGTYYTEARLEGLARAAVKPSVAQAVIKAEQRKMLQGIRALLTKHRTHCKVVVSPLYNRQKLHPADLRALCAFFGADNVFDYSGDNYLTRNPRNYYEPYHYRHAVATRILHNIYR